jgi:uncharacterized repeat protein (TIGR01451 family)
MKETMVRTLSFFLCALVAASAFANAELWLSIYSENSHLVDPGTVAVYRAMVRNTGNEPARNVVLHLPLPPGSDVRSITTTAGWMCSVAGSEVVCTLPELAVTGLSFDDVPRVSVSVALPSDPNGLFFNSLAKATSDTLDINRGYNVSAVQAVVYRILSVTTTADSGAGSLRAAFDDANARCADGVPCKMNFDLPPYSRIEPMTPLPPLAPGWLLIEGNSQLAGDRAVELSGVRLSNGNGIEIAANGTPKAPSSIELRGMAINGFPDYGVAVNGSGDAHVELRGLFIGTDPTGNEARPNGRGIGLFAPRSQVLLYNNLIAGNRHSGVFDWTSLSFQIRGSKVGIGSDDRPLGNGNSGVFAFRGQMVIEGCRIAHNGQFGVSISTKVQWASILGTSIFDNGILGIDWDLDGPSSGLAAMLIPDPPAITDAFFDAATNETFVTGTIDRATATLPGQIRYVDVFANRTRNARGHAEGERLLRSANWITPTPDGSYTFTTRLPGDLRGQIITATMQIGPWADGYPLFTSEFSEGVTVH